VNKELIEALDLNLKLTNDDQEQVATAIAGDKEDPDHAGQAWVEENATRWTPGCSSRVRGAGGAPRGRGPSTPSGGEASRCLRPAR
jgi:hypothetical protein